MKNVQTPKALATISLDDLEQASGGFDLDGDYWQQNYGDSLMNQVGPDSMWYGPTDVFPSGQDSYGYEQGGLGIG